MSLLRRGRPKPHPAAPRQRPEPPVLRYVTIARIPGTGASAHDARVDATTIAKQFLGRPIRTGRVAGSTKPLERLTADGPALWLPGTQQWRQAFELERLSLVDAETGRILDENPVIR